MVPGAHWKTTSVFRLFMNKKVKIVNTLFCESYALANIWRNQRRCGRLFLSQLWDGAYPFIGGSSMDAMPDERKELFPCLTV
jgi:hypothetical protein